MHRRTLGRTGMEVSEVGYGAWGIGGSMWLGADDDESSPRSTGPSAGRPRRARA